MNSLILSVSLGLAILLAAGFPIGAMAAGAPVKHGLLGPAVSDAQLGQARGMANVSSDVKGLLNATSSGNNAVSNTVVGSNSIQGHAFGNASGIVNVIQNFGNNVIIQNAVIVNINMM